MDSAGEKTSLFIGDSVTTTTGETATLINVCISKCVVDGKWRAVLTFKRNYDDGREVSPMQVELAEIIRDLKRGELRIV